jgi:hypothetical protein
VIPSDPLTTYLLDLLPNGWISGEASATRRPEADSGLMTSGDSGFASQKSVSWRSEVVVGLNLAIVFGYAC